LRGECAEFLNLHQCGATYSSTAEFIENIRSFLANRRKWAEMGVKGRAAFLKEFDSSVVYPRVADYIEECLAAQRAGTMEKAYAHA
jgi:hypothetical protein